MTWPLRLAAAATITAAAAITVLWRALGAYVSNAVDAFDVFGVYDEDREWIDAWHRGETP